MHIPVYPRAGVEGGVDVGDDEPGESGSDGEVQDRVEGAGEEGFVRMEREGGEVEEGCHRSDGLGKKGGGREKGVEHFGLRGGFDDEDEVVEPGARTDRTARGVAAWQRLEKRGKEKTSKGNVYLVDL